MRHWRPAASVEGAGWAAVAALIGGLVLLTTWWSRGAWFAGDDFQEIRRAIDPSGPGDPTHLAHWRPLTEAWLRADHRAAGLDAGRYRLGAAFAHSVVACLTGVTAARLARRCGVMAAGWVGAASAVVFVVLPTHGEAVAWVSARGDLVAAAGLLAAVALTVGREAPRARAQLSAAAATLVGAAAKEQALVAPLVVAVLVMATDGRRTELSDLLRRVSPAAVASLSFVLLRTRRVEGLFGSYEGTGAFALHPLRTPYRLVTMTIRTLVPGVSGAASAVGAAVVLAVLGLLALAAWRCRRDERASSMVRLAVAAAAATVAAVLPGVGLGVSVVDGKGERLVYTGSTFAAMAVVAAVAAVWRACEQPRRRRAITVVAAGLLVVSCAGAVASDRRWAASADLASGTLRAGPPWEEPSDVILLTVIDDVAGAYSMRNAAPSAAVVAHGWPSPVLVHEVVPLRAATADATIAVVQTGERTWRLDLGPDLETAGVPGGGIAWETTGVTVDRVSVDVLEVTLSEALDPGDVWFVSGGRLVRLPDR